MSSVNLTDYTINTEETFLALMVQQKKKANVISARRIWSLCCNIDQTASLWRDFVTLTNVC
uniref:Uncharacterized protein n=1 Tax=Anguilla anguilla TaxID=7936 RepID=A0A0E9W6W4_ANGAN